MSPRPSPAAPSRTGTAVRLSLFYAAFFGFIGVQVPFWPVWLKSQGLGPAELAAVLALGTGGRIVISPFFAHLSDRLGERKRLMVVLAALALLSFLLYALTHSFWPIFAVTGLFMIGWAPIMPLGETLVSTTVRERGLDYGRVRLWGSWSFIVATVLTGRGLATHSPDLIFWLLAALVAATMAACILLPDTRVPASSAPRPPLRTFFSDRTFLTFLLAAGLIQSSHGTYYAFGTIHWQNVGYTEDVIGLLWAEGVIAEIVLFAFGATVAKRFSPPLLILLGGLAGILRWTVTGMTDALPALIAVQAFHAFTYGTTHLGAIHFIMRTVPASISATAMSAYSSVTMGLAMSASIFVSGLLYDSFGGLTYLTMTVLAGAGALMALVLMRRWQPADAT